jgi:hypothetical protein
MVVYDFTVIKALDIQLLCLVIPCEIKAKEMLAVDPLKLSSRVRIFSPDISGQVSCAASHPFPIYVSPLSLAKLFLKLPARTTSIPSRDSVVSKEGK